MNDQNIFKKLIYLCLLQLSSICTKFVLIVIFILLCLIVYINLPINLFHVIIKITFFPLILYIVLLIFYLILEKKSYNYTDEEDSENESDLTLKPKGEYLVYLVNLNIQTIQFFFFTALFEDGDVPGECMYNFHLNERKKPNLVKSSSQIIPKSKTKITKNDQDKNKDVHEAKGMLPIIKENT